MSSKHSDSVNQTLANAPLGTLMRRYALPCIISLLVAALYNIVDQIFIANASYLGSAGNAANTAVYPLTVIALAVAVMIGDGCCAFVSIALGADNRQDADRSVGNSVLLSVVSGVVLMLVFLLFDDPILMAFGGGVNETTFAHAKEYFFWISLGIPFYVFGQAMNPIIRADGNPRFAMIATLAGAILNIILDPIFIYPLKLGMAGAAIATVLGQVLTTVLSLLYLRKMHILHLGKNDFRPALKLCGKFLSLGVCSFLAQISLVAAMAAINNMLRIYSASDPVFGQAAYTHIPMAVVGIVMKVFQIIISIVIGMAAGCIPIVGFQVGANRPDRAKGILTRLMAGEFLVGLVSLLIVECFPNALISVFGSAGESVYYTEFAVKAFRTYLCLLPLACVNKAAFIFLQALGRPWVSTFLSMLREVVLGVGLALLLPRFFALDGVLYSMPAADLVTFLFSAVILFFTYRQFNREIKAAKSV
ncbi:MAG: MATE family efflux transporter [Clostridia bacterium]|nr:MATE family efflux transporter [Clostridia bacterium]